MRAAPALAAILLATALLPLIPGAAAEATLSDASGDVTLASGAPGGRLAAPAGAGTSVDLTELAILEEDDSLTFVLAVAGLAETLDGSAEYSVDFSWGRVAFTAYVQRWAGTFGNGGWGFLGVRPNGGSTSPWDLEGVAELRPTFDENANTITFTIPKVFLLDEAQRPPIKGEDLTALGVRATRQQFGNWQISGERPFSFQDAMPDDGATGAFKFLKGDEATGHVLLKSYDRVRVSNGGATTFVFQAIVQNLGEQDDEIQLTLANLPAGWNGTVEPSVVVPAKEEVWVPVIATVPFAHDHGGYTSFALEATSTRDLDAVAKLRLGVLHTPIPQPAGHHDELFLHAARGADASPFRAFWPDTSVSMNTVAEHENEAESVPSMQRDGDGYKWYVPLKPGLQMGLDFDTEGTGTLVGSVIGRTLGDADVSGQLLLIPYEDGGWWTAEDGLLLAQSDVQTVTLDMEDATPFSLTLTPTAESDYIPYQKGQNVMLIITAEPTGLNTACCVEQNLPALVTKDFKMKLPLNEYHDRFYESSVGGKTPLSLIAQGDIQKAGRPGTLLTYQYEMKNGLDKEITIKLDTAGTHADAGELAPQGPLTLKAGETRVLTLGVRVPGDAAAGELVEVLIFAHAVDDPSINAIARTITRVAMGADATGDESAVFAAAREDSNDTPGFGAPFVLAAAVGAVLLAARRRA